MSMLGSKPRYAHLIMSVGSVMFFQYKSYLFFNTTYYWKFRNESNFYGPFDSLMIAGQNFETYSRMTITDYKQQPPNEVVDTSNIIKVDFKSKKRIK